MASNANPAQRGSASESSWRLLYQRACALMTNGEHSKAADVLRVLALAAPGETEIWDALATCHDIDERSDIGDALRSLGRLICSQLIQRSS